LYYHYAGTISTLLINDSILRGEMRNVIDDILPDVKRMLKSNEGSTIKK
jgi:stalled ribosome rescue protein Dom34